MDEKFLVRSGEYEGPFDKILELIQKKKLSINDISLTSITDEYLNYVKENEVKLVNKAKFIWVASVLILLKSKSLLPQINLEKEDQDDLDELKNRLNVLKIYKDYGFRGIKFNWGKNISYRKKYKKRLEVKFRPDKGINFKNLLLSLDGLLSRYEEENDRLEEKKVEKQKSLKEITDEIKRKMERYLRITFKELVLTSDKKEISASFISVLELFRNGFLELKQEEDFGEILIEKTEPNKLIYREEKNN